MSTNEAKKPIPRIFISATSGDLKSVRGAVASALGKLGCLPIEQSNFEPDYRTIEGLLNKKISECDSLIQFVGHRYGAEPEPKSLPKTTPRRSYTQMEYYIAKKLKKKIYIFICADGFPYDQCDAENPEKVALQLEYRDFLREAKVKREKVNSIEECENRVLLLQDQFEELIKALNAEKRQNRFLSYSIFSTVIILLIAVFLISGQLRIFIEKSSQSTISINDQLVNIIDSNLLAEVSKKINVEPGVIRQSLTQFKNQSGGKDILVFVDNLIKQDRADLAYSILLFSCETAITSKTPDYFFLAKAFTKAGESLCKEIEIKVKTKADKNEVEKILKLNFEISQRGIDAFESLTKKQKESEKEIYLLLITNLGETVSNYRWYLAPSVRKDLTGKILAIYEKFGPLTNCSDSGKINFHLVKSRNCLHFADFNEQPDEGKLIEDSFKEADMAYQIAFELKQQSKQTQAIMQKIEALIRKTETVPPFQKRQILEEIINKYDDVPATYKTEDQPLEIYIKILKAQALLDLSSEVLTAIEGKEKLNEANKILTSLNETISSCEKRWVQIYYKEEAVRYFILSKDKKNTDKIFGDYMLFGYFNDKRHLKIWREYILNIAQGDIKTIGSCVEYARNLQKEYTRSISPRFYLDILESLGDFYYLRKLELSVAGIGKNKEQSNSILKDIWEDEITCKKILGEIRSSYTRKNYPDAWVKASRNLAICNYRTSQNDEIFLNDMKEITVIIKKEVNPILWAKIELDKAGSFRNLMQYEDAIISLQLALDIYTQKTFPEKFEKISKEIEEIKSKFYY